ncbi:MAG: hypothetical protein K2I92_09300 [Muribaculaceae bacterium]|nr:hypothetical protein [Muribaculaceae bacterium]
MEEERLKNLFSQYDPELSSSMAFIEHLERNLDTVELIHQENAAVMKRNRIAVAIASCTGFMSGVIFTLLFPYIDSLIKSLSDSMLTAYGLTDSLNGLHLISWLSIGGISVFVTINTYNLVNNILSQKMSKGRLHYF